MNEYNMKTIRTTTENAVKGWVRKMLNFPEGRGLRYMASSASSAGNIFYSYATPIVKFTRGEFHMDIRKYSVTTTKLQNMLRRHIPEDKLVEVDGRVW